VKGPWREGQETPRAGRKAFPIRSKQAEMPVAEIFPQEFRYSCIMETKNEAQQPLENEK